MFSLVFSGNEQSAPMVLAALVEAGFPARVADDCAGFEPELLGKFIEALGSDETFTQACEIVAGVGWRLRLHGTVDNPRSVPPAEVPSAVVSELLARIEKLEAR